MNDAELWHTYPSLDDIIGAMTSDADVRLVRQGGFAAPV
jgi:hypothetical protein